MAKETLNLKLLSQSGVGDSLATIFTTVNENFAQLYTSNTFMDKQKLIKGNIGSVLSSSKNDSLRTILMRVNTNFDELFTKVDALPGATKYKSTDREIINVGTAPNDGTGDSLRTVFNKINNNFTKLFAVAEQDLLPTIQPEVVLVDTHTTNTSGELVASISYEIPDTMGFASSNIEVINVGDLPNDGTGDPLRTAFIKINNNFALLSSTGFFTETSGTTGSDPNQVIFEVPANSFTQGTLQINSLDPITQDSQNITLSVAVENNSTDVVFSGHSTLFYGNCITQYSMDVNSSNVRVLCSPLVSNNLTHTITYQLIQ